jgi:isopenicillin-N epimerase
LYIDHHEWQGFRDLAAFLSVPAAIAYQEANHWEAVRTHCHQLAVETRNRIRELTGFEQLSPPDGWFSQMFTVQLPVHEPEKFKGILYERFRIEVPVYRWETLSILRCSFQGYNDAGDAEALVAVLKELI